MRRLRQRKAACADLGDTICKYWSWKWTPVVSVQSSLRHPHALYPPKPLANQEVPLVPNKSGQMGLTLRNVQAGGDLAQVALSPVGWHMTQSF